MVFKILGALKERAAREMNYKGNKDFLEALLAGAALVAASGGIKPDEEEVALKQILANKTIKDSFNASEVERMFHDMCQKATSFSGKRILRREIEDVSMRGNPQQAEDIVLVMMDVADAEGGIDDDEMARIRDVAGLLRVDVNKLL